jgi:hypothetical protein
VHGSKDEKTLADIMNELTRAKSNLSLRLQVANVGLTRTVENTIVANVATPQSLTASIISFSKCLVKDEDSRSVSCSRADLHEVYRLPDILRS